MDITSKTPDTIKIVFFDNTNIEIDNVKQIIYLKERYTDCAKYSANLNEITKIINQQGYIKIKLWNGIKVKAIEYIPNGLNDDLLLDTGNTLNETYIIPHKNSTRVAYAVFGYWEDI